MGFSNSLYTFMTGDEEMQKAFKEYDEEDEEDSYKKMTPQERKIRSEQMKLEAENDTRNAAGGMGF